MSTNAALMKDYRTHCFHSIYYNGRFPRKVSDLGGNRRNTQKTGSRTHSLLPHPDLLSESLGDMKDNISNTKNDSIKFITLKF